MTITAFEPGLRSIKSKYKSFFYKKHTFCFQPGFQLIFNLSISFVAKTVVSSYCLKLGLPMFSKSSLIFAKFRFMFLIEMFLIKKRVCEILLSASLIGGRKRRGRGLKTLEEINKRGGRDK